MKIWIDLRFINDNLYSKFSLQLVNELIKKKEEDNFIIYTNSHSLNIIKKENVAVKNIWIELSSLKEQTLFRKILNNDKNHLVLFFTHYKPIFYSGQYITILWSLKEFFYTDFSSSMEKYKYFFLAEKNLKKSYKIVCLDKNTQDEIIERFNISEEKIDIIDGFFPKNPDYDYEVDITDLKINLKTKYFIENDFFIYSWWDAIEKNYEKLVEVFERLAKEWENIDLVFLWTHISQNINLRNMILEKKLQNQIHFLGSPNLKEKKYLYKESLWVIFPSFYETFPFRLTEPLFFNTHILSSNLKKIQSIFNDKITYFSAISKNNIYETIKLFLKNGKKKKANYDEIKTKYVIENSVKQLIEILK